MKKKIAAVCITLTVIMMFAGCGSTELSDAFEEEKVITAAEEVIDTLNVQDYETTVTWFDENMTEALPADALEEAVGDAIISAGEFVQYKSATVIGQEIDGEDMATALLVAEYADASHTFSVTFDTDMKVTGLYMK